MHGGTRMRMRLLSRITLLDRRDAFARGNDDVHQAHVVQLLRAIQVAFEHQLLGQARADPLAHEGISAHAREQVEQHLRQSHHHVFLGHDGVAAERRLEAAAQRVALHQGDAVRLHAEPIVEGMHAGDAATGVIEQGGAVLFADQAAEQFQVTPKLNTSLSEARTTCGVSAPFNVRRRPSWCW